MTNPIKFLLTWASPLLINPIDWGSMNPGLSCGYPVDLHSTDTEVQSLREAVAKPNPLDEARNTLFAI